MKTGTALALCALALAALPCSRPALADSSAFGASTSNSLVSLNLTTTAGTVEVPVDVSGWYQSTGRHSSTNISYFTDVSIESNIAYHDFFVFDLGDLDATVLSASVTLNDYIINGNPLYTMYDVSTAVPTLIATNVGQIGIYNDLGSGVVYGSHQYSNSEKNQLSTIQFDSSAVAAINGAEGGFFSFGGSVGNLVTTPEPSTLLLAGPALAGLGLLRRRLRRV